MKRNIPVVFTVLFLASQLVVSQDLELTKKDTIVQSGWMVGVGLNAVDDAGSEFKDFFKVKDNWNYVPYPSRFSLGYYFKNGLGLEGVYTHNQYDEGNTVDNEVILEDIGYFGIDFRINYDLNKILGETGFFDPYVGIGAGYTDANNQGRGTYNANVGFRTWFSDNFGLDFSSTGKWAMNTENATNHLQHAAGVVYRFGIKKGLSPRGEEKLLAINEMQKREQERQDSISAAKDKAEQARLLAERLEREKEAASLAAAEKARQEAERAKRKAIEDQVHALGLVYFNLNSSSLSKSDKRVLDGLAALMEAQPTLIIGVSSHTDVRGSNAYNLALSERRLKRTVAYLTSKGVPLDRLEQAARGESEITNECAEGVYCSDKKHRENRRSQFSVIRF